MPDILYTQGKLRFVMILIGIAVTLVACTRESLNFRYRPLPPSHIEFPRKLPKRALFTLCHLGETVTIIDADTWTIVGHITHPEIRFTSDLAMSDRGILYLTRDGEAGEISETLIPIDLRAGKILNYITLSQAPFRIAISESGIAVVAHVAVLGNGQTQVSFVDTHTNRKIHTQVVDGSATYVAAKDNSAYVLVAAWTPMQENHLLVYDLSDFHIRRRYALPPGDIPLDGNFVIDKERLFYVVLNEDSPRHRYKIIELHMNSGRTRVVAELPTSGELGLVSNGNLIVSSGSYEPETPLRLINISNGKIVKELFVGRNTNVVQSVGRDVFAINVNDDDVIVVIDGRNFRVLQKIYAPCKPFILRMHFAESH